MARYHHDYGGRGGSEQERCCPRTRQPKEGKLQEGFGGRIGPEKLLSYSSSVESLSQRAFIEINCIRLRLPVPIHRVEALTVNRCQLRRLRALQRAVDRCNFVYKRRDSLVSGRQSVRQSNAHELVPQNTTTT